MQEPNGNARNAGRSGRMSMASPASTILNTIGVRSRARRCSAPMRLPASRIGERAVEQTVESPSVRDYITDPRRSDFQYIWDLPEKLPDSGHRRRLGRHRFGPRPEFRKGCRRGRRARARPLHRCRVRRARIELRAADLRRFSAPASRSRTVRRRRVERRAGMDRAGFENRQPAGFAGAVSQAGPRSFEAFRVRLRGNREPRGVVNVPWRERP